MARTAEQEEILARATGEGAGEAARLAGFLMDMVERPHGAATFAELLRRQGWTCTPPAPAPRRRKGGR